MKIVRKKLAIILISVFGIALIGGLTTVIALNSADIKITFMDSGEEEAMSSIMIETGDTRIYVDPYAIDSKYDKKKADIIFLTHPHMDHYDQDVIDRIKKDSTIIVAPTSCTDIFTANNATHEVIGVAPNYTGTAGGISFEAIPAYNINTANMGHLKSYNWCGYIFTIGEYTILQTGDTSCIPEYEDIAGEIDIAILPIGWGCSNMGTEGSLEAVGIIQPTHVIPIHYGPYPETFDEFVAGCSTQYPDLKIHKTTLYLF
ncbi:MBL fold metallo-hydrolase [Candidatus Lokiarchaeum ossiferum]|uniref:MBL fold metallo-hydrolase n=1 Tax=Candidatus Lokiarchaeum ossiferum TaxID=2951803 RepID=UPI00352E9701